MRKTFTLLIFLMIAISGKSQNLYEDFHPLLKGTAEVYAMALQDDGKMILAGNFITVDSTFVNGIARINPDGTLDDSFQFAYDIEGRIMDIQVLDNQKILIGGQVDNNDLNNLLLLNEDGSIDKDFNHEFGYVLQLGLQSDGKIIVVQDLGDMVIRLNSDGTIDNTFSAQGQFDSYGVRNFKMSIQEDDKIVIAGVFSSYNGNSSKGVVRLNADGTVDSEFSVGAGPEDTNNAKIRSLAIQSDGKMILAGDFETFNGSATNNIIRLNVDGSVDETFTIAGQLASLFSFSIFNVHVLDNDAIVVVGGNELDNLYHYRMVKLANDGTYDSEFSYVDIFKDKKIAEFYQCQVLHNANQEIMLGGPIVKVENEQRIGFSIFSEQGQLMETDAVIGGRAYVNAVTATGDGGVILGGEFIEANGMSVPKFVKLKESGKVDTAFMKKQAEGPERKINVIAIQEDGKILLGGTFNKFNENDTYTKLVRLNTDGSLDESFNPQIWSSIGMGVNLLQTREDGKIVIAGGFYRVNGVLRHGFARLNIDGSLDESYNPDNILQDDDEVFAMTTLSDSSIVIGGENYFEGGFLIKTDSMGVKDDSFNIFSLNNTAVYAAQVLKDDDIMFGGYFSKLIPNKPKPIYQIDKEGNLIDSLAISTYGGKLKEIIVENDSTVLISGSFQKVNNIYQRGIAKLDLTGGSYTFNIFQQDEFFEVYDAEVVNDSAVCVVGNFNQVNNKRNLSGVAMLSLDNKVPEILGVKGLAPIPEDSLLAVVVDSLNVLDADTKFPGNFTLTIGEGDNYTLENDTIVPAENYFGTLTVPLTVNDGFDESEVYQMQLEVTAVNDTAVITYIPTMYMTENDSLKIVLSDIQVTDPDNAYPDDFSLILEDGNNYTVTNDTVIPGVDFTGILTVTARVNDGLVDSKPYSFEVEVSAATDVAGLDKQKLVVYPNPFSGSLQVNLGSDVNTFDLAVYNCIGQVVYRQKDVENNATIDLHQLKEGMYFIQLLVDGEPVVSKKIMKK